MSTLISDPWPQMNGISRDIDRILFASHNRPDGRHWVPAVDVREYEDRFEILADVPGVRAEQLDITLDGGILTLAGERLLESDASMDVHRAERTDGRFSRQFRLPDTAAAEGLTAECTDGVLAIRIPKLAQPAPYRIAVKAN